MKLCYIVELKKHTSKPVGDPRFEPFTLVSPQKRSQMLRGNTVCLIRLFLHAFLNLTNLRL